jgi:hypothetical protein
MSSAGTTGYEALLELIEQELQYAGDGRLDELAAVRAARASLIESLPATPPATARATLERANLMHQRLRVELLHCREQLLLELGQLEQAQRTARGYAPALARAPRISADA